MDLQKQINDWLIENDIPPGAHVIVGCSGGPDSMALLHLLSNAGCRPVAAHVNYQKRGEESEQDQKIVENYCHRHNLEFESKRVDPEDAVGNFQNWAREVRYRFFEELFQKYNAEFIAIAHHRDDQLETILLKILRGGHPSTWSGISEKWQNIGRPFLGISKEEIQGWIEKNNIPHSVDSSNLTSGYARNLIRNELAGKLDHLTPGWRENILRMKDYADEYEQMSGYLLDFVLTKQNRIDRNKFTDFPEAARRPVFAAWLRRNGAHEEVARSQYHRLEEMVNLQTGKHLEITGHLIIEATRDEFILISQPVKCAYWSEILAEDRLTKGWTLGKWHFKKSEKLDFGEDSLQLNWQRLQFPLTLRTWNHGDRIQPLGMQGHKKVSDLLTDSKISSYEKNEALVIQAFDRTLCAVIFPSSHQQAGVIAESMRCDSHTQTVLLITKNE